VRAAAPERLSPLSPAADGTDDRRSEAAALFHDRAARARHGSERSPTVPLRNRRGGSDLLDHGADPVLLVHQGESGVDLLEIPVMSPSSSSSAGATFIDRAIPGTSVSGHFMIAAADSGAITAK